MTDFSTGDLDLFAYGKSVDSSKESPVFKSCIYGPYRVVKAKQPRYQLSSSSGRRARTEILARGLRKYHERPSNLQ